MRSGVCAVVGAGFGSEGKGAIVGLIGKDYANHVRVGAANAGHTLYTQGPDGPEKHMVQQVPGGAYANPDANLYLGPGAQISPEIFEAELKVLDEWRAARGLAPTVVFVDYRAHVITDDQIARETKTDLAERIGSTSTIAHEGIGTAAADRVLRASECMTAAEYYGDDMSAVMFGIRTVDVPRMLADTDSILLEGTQGTSLSITTGFFPYCTSRNTTAAGLCADSGIAPTRLNRVIGVLRTYPIRVAGNSGPFYSDSQEITWESIGIDSENERTTVTKKIRRVGTFSMQQANDAAILNGATEFALMFCDYLDPGAYGTRLIVNIPNSCDLADRIEEMTGVPVTFFGTGPYHIIGG